jgi:hypothetical protein
MCKWFLVNGLTLNIEYDVVSNPRRKETSATLLRKPKKVTSFIPVLTNQI